MSATARTRAHARRPRGAGGSVPSRVTNLNGRRGSHRRRQPYTALVLSGGASLGALQVGMLRALYERNITADLLVATSAGALNASFVASRPQTPATANDLARIWRGLQRDDVFPVSVRALVGGLAGQRDHLVPSRGLRRIVTRYLELDDLRDALTPLHLVAYDVNDGRETLLSEGPALDAVIAASSIPGVFPPVPFGNKLLIDGGVANNTPISHAIELGAERIYVLPTQAVDRTERRPPRTALDAAIYGLGLLIDNRFAADVERYSTEAELIVLPAANPLQVQPSDFDHCARLIAGALAASRAMLEPVSVIEKVA